MKWLIFGKQVGNFLFGDYICNIQWQYLKALSIMRKTNQSHLCLYCLILRHICNIYFKTLVMRVNLWMWVKRDTFLAVVIVDRNEILLCDYNSQLFFLHIQSYFQGICACK